MRRIGLIALAIVTIIIVAVLVFAATFDVNRYRPTIQSELEKRLDRKVTLGDMHLSVLPPRFRVETISIGEDPRFTTQNPFVQAQELDVSVKLLPLLKKSVQIDSLDLKRPSVELIKNQQGVWNFASLGSNPEASQPAPAKPAPAAPSPAPQPSTTTPSKPAAGEEQFALGELTITDGQIAITDHQARSARAVYDHIDVTLRDFAPDHPFSLDAATHLPGSGDQEVRLDGKGGPIVQGQPATTPFHGTLKLKQVRISGLAKYLNSPALANTEGSVSGDTKIDSESGKMTLNGQMSIQNPRVHGIDLGYPITAQYDLTDDLAAEVITLRNVNLKLGPTPLAISGMVNTKPTPAQLDVNLKASDVSIAEAARLAAASGTALPAGTSVTGTASANLQARGAADKLALNGTLSARNVQMSGKDIAQPVQVPAVNLTLTPAEIRSDNFNIVSGGTTVAAQLTIQQYLSNSPIVNATLRAPNAQLPAIISMAKAYGVAGTDKVTGAGVLNLDAHAAGPVQGLDSAHIMRALNGTTKLDFNNVRYSGADISHQVAAIAGFLNKSNQSDQGFTNILKMAGNIVVKNGVAQTNDLQAQLDMGNLGVTGTADLVTQALDLRATAVLSKAFTDKLGGVASLSGFMNTALGNSQGETVIPVIVTGTFQNPKFAPDLKQIGQMKLKGLLPNINNPSSAVSGILGGLLGQKGASKTQQQPQQEQQPQNAVEQIMGIFGKKKQQQQPQQQPPK
jgi:AsmA protein